MRLASSAIRVATLPLIAAALGACGSGSTSHDGSGARTTPVILTPGPPPSTPVFTTTPPSGAPSTTFHVALTATQAPRGSGTATIRLFSGQAVICWSFARLVGAARPYSAAVDTASNQASGHPNLALFMPLSGSHYSASGCVSHVENEASAMGQLAELPADFAVVISTKDGTTVKPWLSGML